LYDNLVKSKKNQRGFRQTHLTEEMPTGSYVEGNNNNKSI